MKTTILELNDRKKYRNINSFRFRKGDRINGRFYRITHMPSLKTVAILLLGACVLKQIGTDIRRIA
jgi:hypothetical protein